MTERRCISCYDLLAEADAKVLFADAQPVAWVHPTCLEDYTNDGNTVDEQSDNLPGARESGTASGQR